MKAPWRPAAEGRRHLLSAGLATVLSLAAAACLGSPSARDSSAPAPLAPPLPPAAPGIRVPHGYHASLFVLPGKDVRTPTALAFGPDGRLYVTELTGNIKAIGDTDGDGVADGVEVFARGFASPLGLVFVGNDLYVSSHNRITRLRDERTGRLGTDARIVVADMQARGQHQNNHLAIGPDGKLYVGVGSINNRGPQPHPYNASILQADPATGELQVFATGLRNAFGLAFDARGDLWATDNGWDPPEEAEAPDELNRIEAGADYGFPRVAGRPPPGDPSRPPQALFPAHAAATGIVFYDAELMAELRGSAFVTFWGPQDRLDETIQKVVRVELGPDGPMVSDFAVGPGLERPIAVAVGPTGHLYVADFHSGKIIRIGPSRF